MDDAANNLASGRFFNAWNGQLPGRALLIANPRAGRGRSLGLVNRLAERLRQAGVQAEVALTDAAGHATQLAQSARDEVDLLVVTGGDGTVNEILQAVVPDQPPILIVPAGTENVLAKYLGLTNSISRLWQVIQDGCTVRFDLGLLGQRRFSMLASVGFDAAVVHSLHAERAGHITHLAYFGPVWRQLWQYDWPAVSVVADDREVFRGRGMVVVGNISRYALGLHVCSDALPTDGLLDVFVMQCENQWQLFGWAACVAARMHKRLPGAVHVRASRVAIDAVGGIKIPVEVDGDPAGLLPAELSVAAAAAPLLFWRGEKDKFLPRSGP